MYTHASIDRYYRVDPSRRRSRARPFVFPNETRARARPPPPPPLLALPNPTQPKRTGDVSPRRAPSLPRPRSRALPARRSRRPVCAVRFPASRGARRFNARLDRASARSRSRTASSRRTRDPRGVSCRRGRRRARATGRRPAPGVRLQAVATRPSDRLLARRVGGRVSLLDVCVVKVMGASAPVASSSSSRPFPRSATSSRAGDDGAGDGSSSSSKSSSSSSSSRWSSDRARIRDGGRRRGDDPRRSD